MIEKEISSSINKIDMFFADFLVRKSNLHGADAANFADIVRRLIIAMNEGHSCLPIDRKERNILEAALLVSSSAGTPLVISADKLYLQRYFVYEKRLAEKCGELASICHETVISDDLLSKLPGITAIDDLQKKAITTALTTSLCMITGGPGTGKTSTVMAILVALLQVLGQNLRIALCAPTGKAAMRLQEAVAEKKNGINLPEHIRVNIPDTASTLHRLLKSIYLTPRFKHTAEQPLPYDILIVDEASMVDLALMSKLVDALHPKARLILLGDKDQLVSVESGSVLADLVRIFPERAIELKKTYRFDHAIKSLADAINTGDAHLAWQLLKRDDLENITVLGDDTDVFMGEHYCSYMKVVAEYPRKTIDEVFHAFRKFQVLCPMRSGYWGVEGVNMRIVHYLRRKGHAINANLWYAGRPVLVTRNEYSLDLYNGDIGICLPDTSDGSIKVWFERQNGSFSGFSPQRLPMNETVFAMTIHKSQGSECDNICIVLPQEENRLLTRELLYTAVTRAKKTVCLVATEELFQSALAQRTVRHSGLADHITKYAEEVTNE